jgi:hypothetical protein
METYGLIDREGWAPGPWDGEPDEAAWRSAATGLACRAWRHPEIGCWAGYVEVPRGHPWFGVDYGELPDIRVHGGVTFAGQFAEGWWLGFDCGHFDDVMPGLDALLNRLNPERAVDPWLFGTYKDLRFVRGGCAALALLIRFAG